MTGRRRRLVQVVATLAGMVGVSVVAVPSAVGTDAVVFTGHFTRSSGQPVGDDLNPNAVTFRVSDDGIGGDMHFGFPGSGEIDGEKIQFCAVFDVDLGAAELGITEGAGGSSGIDGTVTVVGVNIDGPCGGGGAADPDSRTSDPVRLDADVTDTRIKGTLELEGLPLEFDTSAVGSADNPTTSSTAVGQRPETTFESPLSEDDDLLDHALAFSVCDDSYDPDHAPPEQWRRTCDALRNRVVTFNRDMDQRFNLSSAWGHDLRVVTLLADLRTPDGKHLFPSLNGMIKVLAAMAKNAQSAADQDAALVPLRRLVRLLVDRDIQAQIP